MKKFLPILIIVVVGFAAFILRKNTLSYQVAHSGMDQTQPVKCNACGKMSVMTFDEMNALIKAGKTVDVPMQFKKFQCSTCGKIEVSVYDGKYDELPEAGAGAPQ